MTRGAWSPKGDGKPPDVSKIKPPTAGAIGVYSRDSFDRVAAAKRELAALERDAAISMLLKLPSVCEAPHPRHLPLSWPSHCGKCWTCRVDKFLRDVGARK